MWIKFFRFLKKYFREVYDWGLSNHPSKALFVEIPIILKFRNFGRAAQLGREVTFRIFAKMLQHSRLIAAKVNFVPIENFRGYDLAIFNPNAARVIDIGYRSRSQICFKIGRRPDSRF